MVSVLVLVSRNGRRPRGDAFPLNLLFKGVARQGTRSKEPHGEQDITEADMKNVQVQLVEDEDVGGWKLARL